MNLIENVIFEILYYTLLPFKIHELKIFLYEGKLYSKYPKK